MTNVIKYNPKKNAPDIAIEFKGGMRVRYHLILLSPKGNGEILGEWRGNNIDSIEDKFSVGSTGNELKFASISWQFDVFPTPNVPGEKYWVKMTIKQGADLIFEKEYENSNIERPEIITEDGIFVPK